MAHNDFEFYYLIELTKQKIKPLSRWEKPLTDSLQQELKKHGLFVDTVPRKTFFNRRIYETIFSTSSRYLNLYQHKFYNTSLKKNGVTQKIEGLLFGYPSCCVNQFIRKPYHKNNLNKNVQEILFHWACSECRATAQLVPYYQTIHNQTMQWYKKCYGKSTADVVFHWHKKMMPAIAASLLFSFTVADNNSHRLPLENDLDADGLKYAEEFILGSDYQNSFTLDGYGGLDDGAYLSRFFKTIIDSLPTKEQTDKPYRIDHETWGVEACSVCGAYINMGYVTIVNPLRKMQLDIPYIGLHYLDSLCFSYDGEIHTGRIAIDTLKQILFPYDAKHILPIESDSDKDGLSDSDEYTFYFNPENSDSDQDSVPDGAQIAEHLIRIFPKLTEVNDQIHSYITFQYFRGIVTCNICGRPFNMGYVEITNPENGSKHNISFIDLHAMAHGNSFANFDQKVGALALYRALETHMLHIHDDADNDGLNNNEEAYFNRDPKNPDSNNNGICDGKEIAQYLAQTIDALSIEPALDKPYVVHYQMDGIVNCHICGEALDMGFMEIYNPKINTIEPFTLSYYAFHFMQHGSFSYDFDLQSSYDLSTRHIDPILLSHYLDIDIISDVQLSDNKQPKNFGLKQNFPNPFNPTTAIHYTLHNHAQVKLKIYTIEGKLVKTLVNAYQNVGDHSVQWDGKDAYGQPVSSGIYLYQLQAGASTQTKHMLLIK
jgi:hypothetical protein